jgi:DNA polymerase-3 subunit gamma/tau
MLEDFTQAILQSDAQELIRLVDRLVQSGLSLQHFVREMLWHIRNLMMLKIIGTDPHLIPLAPAEMARAREFADRFTEEDLTRFFGLLVSTESDMRWASQPRFQLEMGLMKILQVKKLVSIEELLAKLGGNQGTPSSGTPPSRDPGTARRPGPSLSGSPQAGAAVKLQAQVEKNSTPVVNTVEFFHEIRHAVFEKSPMVSALLDHVSEISLHDNVIEITFPAKEKFSHDMLQARENLQLVQGVAETVTGKARPAVLKLEGTQPPDIILRKNPRPERLDRKEELIEQIKEDSAVRNFLDTFQGEIIEIKEIKS